MSVGENRSVNTVARKKHPRSDVPTKVCRECEREQANGEFHSNKHNRDGLASYCRACTREKDMLPRNRYSRIRALIRGREPAAFDISFEEWHALVQKPCFYCGWKVDNFGRSMDQLIPQGGYRIGNVVPCCGFCNGIKGSNLTVDEMKRVGVLIREFREERKKSGISQLEYACPVGHRTYKTD
jgi:hypothetical protein